MARSSGIGEFEARFTAQEARKTALDAVRQESPGDHYRKMSARIVITRHERRLSRHAEARGEPGHVEALLHLKGTIVGGRHQVVSLYDVGGESAVYLTQDLRDPEKPQRIAKVILLPVHKPFELESRTIRKQRENLRVEADFLKSSGSIFLPRFRGLFEFKNPLLDPARGGAFTESEPLLLMDKLPGRDLDRWLARMHRSTVPIARMRRTLDRVAVMMLQALVDLYDRGLIYADLRPANLRVMGRPDRIVRLLDGGSLVRREGSGERFPHVPSYLPPELFWDRVEGRTITPSAESQVVMAGRSLFEVATGVVPVAGREVNYDLLRNSNVSPPVEEVIEGLCRGDFAHVRHAYRYLVKRAAKRVKSGNDPDQALKPKAAPAKATMAAKAAKADEPLRLAEPAPRPRARRPAPAVRESAPARVKPQPPERKGLLARLLSLFRRK